MLNGVSSSFRWWLAGIVATTLIFTGGFWLLEKTRQAQSRDLANQIVAQGVTTAQDYITRRDWNWAIETLENALKTKDATELDAARALLAKVLELKAISEATMLLASAENAIEENALEEAKVKLRNYIASKHASQKAKATSLLFETELVTSDQRAIELLVSISDESLGAC